MTRRTAATFVLTTLITLPLTSCENQQSARPVIEERFEGATVEMDVFSGRPNPSWKITEEEEKDVYMTLMSLSGTSSAPFSPSPPGLGYRGLRIQPADQRNTIRVYRKTVQSGDTYYFDSEQKIEQFLFATARRSFDQQSYNELWREWSL